MLSNCEDQDFWGFFNSHPMVLSLIILAIGCFILSITPSRTVYSARVGRFADGKGYYFIEKRNSGVPLEVIFFLLVAIGLPLLISSFGHSRKTFR